jgi:hypothetical protein
MKNSFSLLELIIVILISSIVIINSLFFLKESYFINKDLQNTEILKIDLLSTKIFLNTHVKKLEDSITLKNKTLFFKENILLEEVTFFSIEKKTNYFQINITLNEKVKQLWKIKR